MSTKTITEKYENGKLVERTTVETFDKKPYVFPYPLFGGGIYESPKFKYDLGSW